MTYKQKLNFIKYCISKRNDTRFIKNVMGVQNDWTLVNLENKGNKRAEKAIYHIALEASYSGFFADHNRVLSLLYYADYFGFIPVVEYSKEYCYAEKHPVNGTENPFEYYFKQPTHMTLEKMNEYKGIIRCRKENAMLAGELNHDKSNYGMSDAYLTEMARISNQYIRLNDVVEKRINFDVNDLLQQKKTLGVHVRGTDFKKDYNGHPKKVTTEEYLSATEKLFHQGNYNKVFLATDDAGAIVLFQQALGNKVCYYQDVTRSAQQETVMKSESQRENHHYLLGLEVLRDMYTLAACDGLVAGLSQVSYSARIQKKSYGVEYENLMILDKGINANRQNCPT